MKSKSVALTGLFIAVCLLFSACYAPVTRKKPIGKRADATRVLIYTVDEAHGFRVPENASLPEPYVLPEDELEPFLKELSKLSYTDSILYVPNDPEFIYYGYVVKIEYNDGAEEWLSGTHMTQYTDADGMVKTDHYSPDFDDWEEVIAAYLTNGGE